MFEHGLTIELVTMLQAIVDHVIPLRAYVVDNLLKMLQRVLRSYPKGATGNTETLHLALMTLANFNFSTGHMTPYATFLTFAHDGVLQFLAHPTLAIREAACLACAPLLIPPRVAQGDAPPPDSVLGDLDASDNSRPASVAALPTASAQRHRPARTDASLLSWDDIGSSSCSDMIQELESQMYTISHDEGETVKEAIRVLLQRGVSDSCHNIRLSALLSLDEPFLSPYLADTSLLRLLVTLLHDSYLEVRLLAMRIVGRLVSHNPSVANPKLMVTASQLLSNIQSTNISRVDDTHNVVIYRNDSDLQLLAQLVRSAPTIASLYVQPILSAVLPRLRVKENTPMVVSRALSVVGALAHVDPAAVKAHLPEIMPILLVVLKDQASILRRRNGFRTLADLSQGVGYVIEPYRDFPELMAILTDVGFFYFGVEVCLVSLPHLLLLPSG